jgi:hypothetical protein
VGANTTNYVACGPPSTTIFTIPTTSSGVINTGSGSGSGSGGGNEIQDLDIGNLAEDFNESTTITPSTSEIQKESVALKMQNLIRIKQAKDGLQALKQKEEFKQIDKYLKEAEAERAIKRDENRDKIIQDLKNRKTVMTTDEWQVKAEAKAKAEAEKAIVQERQRWIINQSLERQKPTTSAEKREQAIKMQNYASSLNK